MTLKCAIIKCEKGQESISTDIQQSKDKGLDLVELRVDRYLFMKDNAVDATDVSGEEVTTEEEKADITPDDESDSIDVLIPIAEVTEDDVGDADIPASKVEAEEPGGKPDETDLKPSLELLEEVIRDSPLPVLCSVQRKENGGWFEGELDDRRAILKKIIEYSPTYLEVELDDIQMDQTFSEIIDDARKKSIKVIISKYNTEGCYSEDEFEYVLRSMYEMNGDIYKISCNISSFTHLANIFAAAFEMRKEEKTFTFHGTGKLGNKCAQYAPILGSVMAFCSPNKDEKVEDNLVDIELLDGFWNILIGTDIEF